MTNQNCSFNINNYDIQDKVSYERVIMYKRVMAVDRRTNKEVDILTFDQKDDDGSFSNIKRGLFYNNVYISQFLNLPGIVKLIEYQLPLAEEDSKSRDSKACFSECVAVFEHMKYSSFPRNLPTKEINSKEINSTVISKIIFGIAAIMKQIHYRNICLENLSLDSISLDDNLEPHITNFGSAHFVFSEDDIAKEPNHYFPEEYPSIKSSFVNDVYSFGFLILEMFAPNMLSKFQYYMMLEGVRPMPDSIPNVYRELITKCISKNIEQLPSFMEITELLRDDKYVFSRDTDLEALHEYQNRIDDQKVTDIKNDIEDYCQARMNFT